MFHVLIIYDCSNCDAHCLDENEEQVKDQKEDRKGS
jgi:hypothetical protein